MMKMIRAIIRPEREEQVLARLEAVGLYAMSKYPVVGRGRQRGIQVGAVSYDTLCKIMLMMAVSDQDYAKAIQAIQEGAGTGHPGDGRIFVQTISKAYTIRTGSWQEVSE
jgi:nitrogen regulatory protein PII 1